MQSVHSVTVLDSNRERLLEDRYDIRTTREQLRVTTSGRSNKSLDASGVSGLLIHDLSVAQSSAASSTQPLSDTTLLIKGENHVKVERK